MLFLYNLSLNRLWYSIDPGVAPDYKDAIVWGGFACTGEGAVVGCTLIEALPVFGELTVFVKAKPKQHNMANKRTRIFMVLFWTNGVVEIRWFKVTKTWMQKFLPREADSGNPGKKLVQTDGLLL
ncbi:hypothetical protein [Pontibacter sp. SGAir0037]|uniref:hypothetical protein n=1 Tax=Pontibacter sp. SGAir0037 TaxID=2571030 RepID=UPI0010F54835|nr:hypothetical protein [Pontibacter sp. SGAir0037]